MLHEKIPIGPLLCGACLSVYVTAVLIIYFEQKKKEREGRPLPPFRLRSRTLSFLAILYPVWIITNSGAYFSAALGALGGALAWVVLILLRKKRNT